MTTSVKTRSIHLFIQVIFLSFVLTLSLLGGFHLWAQKKSASVALPLSDFHQTQTEFEANLSENLHQMLSQVIGKNAVKVSVHADLDFEEQQITREFLDASPVPGERKEDSFYGFAKRTSLLSSKGGRIKRLSVAVLLDNSYKIYTAEEQQNIKSLIRSTIGFDASRGDTLDVQTMPFVQSSLWQKASVPALFVFVIIVLLVVILGVLWIRSISLSRQVAALPKIKQPEFVKPEAYGMLGAAAQINGNVASPIRQTVQRLIDERPNETLTVLRSWQCLENEKVLDNLSYENLTGTQKVAILLMSMGDNVAKSIFEKMEDEEIKDISLSMADLGIIDKTLVERVLNEFIVRMTETSEIKGNFNITEKFLKQVLPQSRQHKIVEEMQSPVGQTVWDKLAGVSEETLAEYLKNEYPQTIAVILSRLQPTYAAKVMALLPESLVMDVVMRMLHLEKVQKEVLQEIEQTIKTDFIATLNKTEAHDQVDSVANIFNNLDSHTENRLMTGLFERNRNIAENIRSRMFTFEDLVNLSSEALQKILRMVDRKQIAMALKGASETLKAFFLENMSENAGLMLQEDMDVLGAVRVKDVDDAQTAIIKTAKEMIQDGSIEYMDKSEGLIK